MYVMIAAAEADAWPRLQELLDKLGLRTERVSDASELTLIAACDPPSVALVDPASWGWAHPILSGPGCGDPPCMVVGEPGAVLPEGAHSMIPADATGEEVALALMALALEGVAGDDDGSSFTAWSATSMARLDSLLASEFTGMLGLGLTAEPANPELPLELCAEIHLALPTHNAEVVLGLGFDLASARALSVLLFGEDLGIDMMRDAVQEFANTAGGAMKRAASRDGLTFSLGLPTPDIAHIRDATYGRRLVADTFSMSVWAHTLRIDDMRHKVTDLQEGAVLAEAVLGTDGDVLVPAGAVLTSDTVRRIHRELGPDEVVVVSRAA